jgi:N-acetyl sugar amidotransferase
MGRKNKMENYQVCTRCVMDTTADDITFDKDGHCNFCNKFIENIKKHHSLPEQELAEKREALIENIKKDGKNKPYDCIVGVSGGVDSSYVLYLTKRCGLRPLAVHLDNGWNSELSVQNISNLVNKLGVDLYTHVVDWEEKRDIQLAFFAAHVIDIEMLTDSAIADLNFKQAKKYRINYILAGTNSSTEGMIMPSKWYHYKYDKKNIMSIQKKFGTKKLKTYTFLSTFDFLWNQYIVKRRWISFLDYFDYKKTEALDILVKNFDYKPYPYKHYESVFTRFYQGYILPKKFNVDKRRLHLSTLIITGQMTRDAALEILDSAPYPDPEQEKIDKEFVLKKLGFTEETFDQYINSPGIPHKYYGSEKWMIDTAVKINKIRKRLLS